MDLTTFLNLLTIIGVLFMVMLVGYWCRHRDIINDVSSNRMSKLIIEIGQPALIIGALISKPFSWELLREGLLYLAIGFLLHPLMGVIALLCGRFFPEPDEKNLSAFALTFTNAAFIGFPILAAIFPGKGPFYGAFFVVGFNVYVWTFGIWLLSRGRDDIKLTPKKALLNFGTVPCFIGLALYLLKAVAPTPTLLVDFCGYLGNLCMPISVLIIGALIATQDLGAILKSPHLYLFNTIKLIVLPLIVCVIAKLVTLGFANSYELVMFCTVISALPSASTVAMLAELYGIKPGYAAQAVGSSSIFSVATLPLLYFIGDFVAKL
ncbi:MAG: AEC family transporter [Clostridia bacterium]|nr:AEC family transporter [Clostridia bacterium]MBR7112809.1 AEC family transporter [Clostridia bacterium]